MDKGRTEILTEAIGESGIWTWWVADLPGSIQFEFHNCQLYLPSASVGDTHSTQIALRFFQPVSVNFICTDPNNAQNDWQEAFREGKMDYLELDERFITFEPGASLQKLLKHAKQVNTVHGVAPWDPDFPDAAIHFGFIAESFGVIIAAEGLGFFTHQGEITFQEVKQANSDWINYWKQYWARRDSIAPLPEDWLCESIIPAEEISLDDLEQPPKGDKNWLSGFFSSDK